MNDGEVYFTTRNSSHVSENECSIRPRAWATRAHQPAPQYSRQVRRIVRAAHTKVLKKFKDITRHTQKPFKNTCRNNVKTGSTTAMQIWVSSGCASLLGKNHN